LAVSAALDREERNASLVVKFSNGKGRGEAH
jgi:hypothetical protein